MSTDRRNQHVHPIFADIMNRFAPIPCPLPDLRKPPALVHTSMLEPARVGPCEAGMDDCADWMVNGGKEILEGMLCVECPESQS